MKASIRPIALVPMRHDSERVSGKNYRSFNGRPLFHYVLEELGKVEKISKVVVDTDSPVIAAQLAESFPRVKMLDRPEHLREGSTPMTAVLQHDASKYPSEWYLQTHSTNPLLRAETLARAIDVMERCVGDFDSLFSVTRLQTRLYDAGGAPMNHDPSVLLRTQDLPPVFEENSNIYLFTAEQVRSGRRFGRRPFLFEIDPVEAVDIDTESDFTFAEFAHREFNRRTR